MIESYKILGIPIHAVQIPDVVQIMNNWIKENSRGHTIVAANSHVVNEARRNPDYGKILRSADLVVADGMPLVLMGRINGFPMKRRVYGPELMEASLDNSYRHFFFGGDKGVAEDLARQLQKRVPHLQVAGTLSPERATAEELGTPEILDKIKQSRPDILWVGLGAPKQEKWMHLFREKLDVPVMIGVGAAFDFHTGRTRQAPSWMQEHGLEWLFRLVTEPRRLWKRYLIQGPEFALYLMGEIISGKHRGNKIGVRSS